MNQKVLLTLILPLIISLATCGDKAEKRKQLLAQYSGPFSVIKGGSVYDQSKDGKSLGRISVGEQVTVSDVDPDVTNETKAYAVYVTPSGRWVPTGWIFSDMLAKEARKIYNVTNDFKSDLLNTIKIKDVTTSISIAVDNLYVTINYDDHGKLQCFVDPVSGKDCETLAAIARRADIVSASSYSKRMVADGLVSKEKKCLWFGCLY
jgi:hypothetical protein